MSNIPFATPAALQCVRELKTSIAEAASREERIVREHRLEVARAKRQHAEKEEALAAKLENGLASAQSKLHRRREFADEKLARRSAWIDRAYSNAERRVTSNVEGKKGRQISKVQARTLEAKRERETELAFYKTQLAEIQDELRKDKRRYTLLKGAARAAFRGFPKLSASLSPKAHEPDEEGSATAPDLVALGAELQEKLESSKTQIRDFDRQPLPKLFRFLPLQWVAPIGIATIASIGYLSAWGTAQFLLVGGAFAAAMGALFALQRVAVKSAIAPAAAISADLNEAADIYRVCARGGDAWLDDKRGLLNSKLERTVDQLNTDLGAVIQDADKIGDTAPSEFANQWRRLVDRNELACKRAVKTAEESARGSTEQARGKNASEIDDATTECAQAISTADATLASEWRDLESFWRTSALPQFEKIRENSKTCAATFPAWDAGWMASWSAPSGFAHAAPYGSLLLNLEELAGALPEDARLGIPEDAELEVPLALGIPTAGSLLIESDTSGDQAAASAINNVILRLLSVAPAGKLSFSIFDPVGLGQNFAGVTHLADYEDSIINKRIWTAREQIETRIGELCEHMEKVIQMYLRNEYETITDYNRQAGNIAEKYHFLVVADFPTNFSEAATRGLMSIAASGARCGIYTILHWDKRTPVPEALAEDDLRRAFTCLKGDKKGNFTLKGSPKSGALLRFAQPPDDALATEFVKKIGEASSDSNRIEVPFSHIMPAEADLWQNDTTDELRIPIGRTGATKLQMLSIGKGTRQHALFAGKTGSGKSTLFHVIITNLALSCSPDQVEFYLIDFKKGVEFKCYGTKGLPHARVVAIESDREFGLSVLQRLDEELKRRGELFRERGVQDLAGYKRAGGGEMPRTLLMIDEFQEFFVEDDRIAQAASVLLDRIVRQGRAFGIHVLLGSQTLGGAYSLARATLGQMVIRVALMCNEADAYLIMDEGNPAPRLLTRPGEGIYNDSAGAVEGNSPFQTVWLPEEERDALLDQINELQRARGTATTPPIVFEGNAPADIAENALLAAARAESPTAPPADPRIWLGAPNAIKGPTEAVLRRQSGNHLLIVSQRDDAVASMMAIAMVSLSAQYPKGGARFVLIDSSAPGTAERTLLDRTVASIPHAVSSSHDHDLAELVAELAEELKRRGEEGTPDDPPIFVLANGLQRFKKLRYDDDLAYSFDASADAAKHPALQLNDLLCEGASSGIHLIAAIDTYNNIGRTLSRKALGEFEMRVLFQMSANDSAALVDATKAANLGMHRAIFYNEHEGYLETFRPYAAPGATWLDEPAQVRT